MVRPSLVILVATLLGGCSSTFFFLPDGPPSPETGPADYQALVAKDLNNLQNLGSKGPFEISPLRQTQLTQPGDWFACVRTSVQDRPTYIAVFLRDGRVIDRRQAVLVDGCIQEQFQPMTKVADSPSKKQEPASKTGAAPARHTEGPPARPTEESPPRPVEESPARWLEEPASRPEELRR